MELVSVHNLATEVHSELSPSVSALFQLHASVFQLLVDSICP
jgi:hypothetical protein